MKKIIKILDNIEKFICVIVLIIVLLALFYQVVTRYIWHYTPEWAEELSRYLLIWLIYVGASYAMQKRAHLKIDSAIDMWPVKVRKVLIIIGLIILLIFNVAIFAISLTYTFDVFSMGQFSISMKMNLGWAYLAIPLGFFFMAIRTVINIINIFTTYGNDDDVSILNT